MKYKIKKFRNVSLKDYTTFHIGGIAKKMYFPKNEFELRHLVNNLDKRRKKYIILGNGSNILFTEKIYQIIICMSNFSYIFLQDDEVVCGAGTKLCELSKFCETNELGGLEFCCGIPGTVGGAICMNAGAFGSEICGFVSGLISFENGEIKSKECLNFSYRQGPLNGQEIVLEAKFKLNKEKNQKIIQKKHEIIQKRMNSQPSGFSAGSIFKRGENFLPAKLIDEWGLKGIKVGGAKISEKHAGFIINDGSASAEDVLTLIELIEKVAQNHGYIFEKEIKIV